MDSDERNRRMAEHEVFISQVETFFERMETLVGGDQAVELTKAWMQNVVQVDWIKVNPLLPPS